MSDLNISKIRNITPTVIREVLRSSQISHSDKVQFIRKNSSEIKNVLDITLTPNECSVLMGTRPLIKGHLIRNTATKRGDRILLAKTLKIPVSKVNNFVKNVQGLLKNEKELNLLSDGTIDAIKTYVYRNGSTEQLGIFFDHELSKSKNILKTLSHTLSYKNCGVADYFLGPLHRMKNSTLVDLYHIIDKNLTQAVDNGQITDKQYTEASEWALKQIYQIQHNSKFLNAVKNKII